MTLSDPKFKVATKSSIPRLSWLAKMGLTTTVYCGEDVEIFETGIIEGCWDGEFSSYAFNRAENLFGSGFKIDNGIVTFCTPSHTIDGLYVLFQNHQTYVSNSLPFLFSFTGLPINYNYNYTKRLITLLKGINNYTKLIYESGATRLYRVLYDNFVIAENEIRYIRKNSLGEISDYDSYHSCLRGTLDACLTNAKDQHRKREYTPVATCSSGYDSNAAAALGAALGCEQAITLKSARSGDDDSGVQVATALGMRCEERARPDRPQSPDYSELEFLNNGMGGGDFVFTVFEDQLEGKICLTGYNGDKLWSPQTPPDSELIRGGYAGSSLSEFRQRVGFIHIPVPVIAARKHHQIQKISNSVEMDPYRIGGQYDRPIARRIIENMGVERSLFGHSKKAVTIGFIWGPKYLSSESRKDFNTFLKNNGQYSKNYLSLAVFHVCNYFYWLQRGVLRRATRIFPSIKPLLNISDKLLQRFKDYEGTHYCNLLFIWALEKSKVRYGIEESDARPE